MLRADGSAIAVTTVASSSGLATVYNLSIAGRATYGVGELGTLVHNSNYDDYDCKKRSRHGPRKGKEVRDKPGEGFRGGSKDRRDRNFGITDKDFWQWWHREGKRAWGGGDLTKDIADQVFQEWQNLGRP